MVCYDLSTNKSTRSTETGMSTKRCHSEFQKYPFSMFLLHVTTVESRFYEPPRERKIGLKNRRVREIGGKITVFD